MTEESPARGKHGRFVRTIDTAERDAQAARLRAHGMGLREIAERLDYANESGVSKAISRALTAVPVQAAGELRELECRRLDALTAEAWSIAARRHPMVTPSGKPVTNPDGEQVYDDAPVLRALEILLRISERRSKLLGLDSPKRLEIEGPHITLEMIDAEIARMRVELAALPETPERAPLPWPAESGSGEAS